jgi:hypothetical protein
MSRAQALCEWCAVCMRMCEPSGLLQLGYNYFARLRRMLCRNRNLLHAFVVCDVVRALLSIPAGRCSGSGYVREYV